MSNVFYNILVLITCWLFVSGAGIYITYFKQPEEMERLEKSEKVARLKEAEASALIAEEATTEQQAESILRRWQARYKVIPKMLESAQVIGYMNKLTGSGFENFDVTYDGKHSTTDFSYHSYNIAGRGYFNDLYGVIWELENNRNLYRVFDVNLNHIDLVKRERSTELEHLKVMVSFNMKVYAYYGGASGLSAEDSGFGPVSENDNLPIGQGDGLPFIPDDVLPKRKPALNPFSPLIKEQLPPNTYDDVDMDRSKLVSIVGDKAIFEYNGEYRPLGVGDPVYLGQVTVVDPNEGRVVVRLNLGGIIDEIELKLQSGEQFRQALGPVKMSPVGSQQ
jgi:hypothetical protein